MNDLTETGSTKQNIVEFLDKKSLAFAISIAVFYTVFVSLSLGGSSSSFDYLPDLVWFLKLPFAFLASWALALVGFKVFWLFDDGERQDLAIVCAGGALGGFSLKFAVLLIEAPSRPAIPLDHTLCALLGAMCAGFTIFTISDTERRQKSRLFFLSIAAGLAFPSIVLTAMKFEPETVASATQKVEKASELKEGLGRIAPAERQKQIDALSSEVASEANEITNATNLTLEERKRQLEKLEPLAESAFDANSSAVKAIVGGKQKLDQQITAQVLASEPPPALQEVSATPSPSPETPEQSPKQESN